MNDQLIFQKNPFKVGKIVFCVLSFILMVIMHNMYNGYRINLASSISVLAVIAFFYCSTMIKIHKNSLIKYNNSHTFLYNLERTIVVLNVSWFIITSLMFYCFSGYRFGYSYYLYKCYPVIFSLNFTLTMSTVLICELIKYFFINKEMPKTTNLSKEVVLKVLQILKKTNTTTNGWKKLLSGNYCFRYENYSSIVFKKQNRWRYVINGQFATETWETADLAKEAALKALRMMMKKK